MGVRKGKRYVRVSSPLSVLAIGLVYLCGGMALIFLGRFFPEEVMNDEVKSLFFWGGVYMLSIGVPSILVFVNLVLSSPKEMGYVSIFTPDRLIVFMTFTTSSIGVLSLGIYLLKYKKELQLSGVILTSVGGIFTLVLILVLLFFGGEKG